MSRPAARQISRVRGFTTCAWGARWGPSRRSTTRHAIPPRASRMAAINPTGPAPTTRTGTSTRSKRRLLASVECEQHDGHGQDDRQHGEHEHVLVVAEDVHVDARHRDQTLVDGREDIRRPESSEVAALP